MTVKTDYARFDIHDELTAPAGSERLLKSISTSGGAVSKLVGVLAGSPATLRAFARMRSELHSGDLPPGPRAIFSRAAPSRVLYCVHHWQPPPASGASGRETSRAPACTTRERTMLSPAFVIGSAERERAADEIQQRRTADPTRAGDLLELLSSSREAIARSRECLARIERRLREAQM